jgi:N-acetyldiaminopimelate deacetylase
MFSEERLKDLRKILHENPELSFLEYKTASIIKDFVSEVVGNNKLFTLHEPFATSVVVEYKGGSPDDSYFIFRADMDALPVKENSLNPYVSGNEGIMHACGHDIHMTVLCGLIAKVAEKKPSKNILFVFQPGEEGAGGAKKMMESGFFDSYNVKSAFALHVTDGLEFGEVGSNGDVLFAIPKEINVLFKGNSGHAAYPEKGNDALAVAASFLANIEHKIRKVVNPSETFLIHFGKISGGTARNIIADEVKIEGTLRAFDRNIMTLATEEIKNTAENAARNFGCRSEVTVLGEYLEVKNDPDLFNELKTVCRNIDIKCIEKKAGLVGEDFCYFTDRYSGLLFWIGTKMPGKEEKQLHSSDFFPPDEVVTAGVKILFSLLTFQ